MGKVIFQSMVSLNGFFEGDHKETDWHHVDEEFINYSEALLSGVDILLFGRITYELMLSYWPTPTALAQEPGVAAKMNSLPKIVFSTTMEQAGWNNTRVVKNNISKEIDDLKSQGKIMAIFGSSNLALTFIKERLIDEFRVVINPIALGGGTPLFNGIDKSLQLDLKKTATFRSGNIMLFYEPCNEK
jgi:dihydrofolate reductase